MIRFDGDKTDLDKCGIYRIVNIENGKQYVGSTKSFGLRFRQHNSRLKGNTHDNVYLQWAFNKYGAGCFEIKIIEICDNYKTREQEILDNEIFCMIDHQDHYYNIAKSVIGGMTGRKHTEEAKLRIGGRSGNKSPMFGRRGENHPAFGMKHSAEAIKNTAEKQRGRLSYQYISDILAKNMETGEEIVAESAKEMALKLSVSKKTILNRLNNKSKSFTSSLIKNIWRISRVLS